MNITGKYLKVWKKKEQNGFTKLDLGDSKKNKDDTYTNWTWFDCLLVGNAKNVTINENDTVEIKNGIISQEKYQDKWYTRIVIFDIEVMHKGNHQEKQQKPSPEPNNEFNHFQSVDDLDGGIPF
jgi:hypothetical protein